MTISSEWREWMIVAHRIIVMSGARVRDDKPLPAFDERCILDAAFVALNMEHFSYSEGLGISRSPGIPHPNGHGPLVVSHPAA